MSGYSVNDIKKALENNDFDSINKIVNDIKNKNNIYKEDLEILKYLGESEFIDQRSKDIIKDIHDQSSEKFVDRVEESEIIGIDTEDVEKLVNEGIVTLDEDVKDLVQNDKINEELVVVEEPELQTSIVETSEPEVVSEVATDNDNPDVVSKEEKIVEEIETNEQNLATNPAFSGFMNDLSNKGLKVDEFKVKNGAPLISFELNPESKAYLDNMMIQLNNEKDPEMPFDLSRVATTNQELFTIYFNKGNMTTNELIDGTQKLASKVNQMVSSTDKYKDYTNVMPDTIKNLNDKFVNDKPDLPKDVDYRIGCMNVNGDNQYYVFTSNNINPEWVTDEMNKTITKVSDNIYRVDDVNDHEKMAMASDSLSEKEQNMVNTMEKQYVKKLVMPTGKNSGSVDIKSVLLVIFLIIIVMIIVYMMG